jgi:hypothetical protein
VFELKCRGWYSLYRYPSTLKHGIKTTKTDEFACRLNFAAKQKAKANKSNDGKLCREGCCRFRIEMSRAIDDLSISAWCKIMANQ